MSSLCHMEVENNTEAYVKREHFENNRKMRDIMSNTALYVFMSVHLSSAWRHARAEKHSENWTHHGHVCS